MVAIGLGLIGLCHLPFPLRARAGLIVVAAAALALVRAGWLTSPAANEFQEVILPVLAAMFMFRLAIYLYDLGHETVPATLSERLSYFFLLPNVSFLLFPVVDYQTYRRSYYDGEPLAIYQKGLLWMVRGLVHLLLYRIIYHYLVLPAGEINDLGTVVQFMVTSYLLYLRISGQFHLIVGILCLFGYNLPETHHLYFLSSGFNDFWRRINIYWKDFMMKMVYYPAFVPLHKRFGMTAGIVIATLIVFLGTWFLHSYQWFWLRNSYPLAAADGVFWGLLGLMVVVNSLIEAGTKKKKQTALTFTDALTRSAKTVGFFALMSVLWSLWSSASPGEWLAIVSRAGNSGASEFVKLAAVLAAAIAGGVVFQFAFRRHTHESVTNRPWLVPSSALYVTAVASVLVFITLPYPRTVAGPQGAKAVALLRQDRMNTKDQELANRGYYEGLLEQRNFTAGMWAPLMGAPHGWVDLSDAGIADGRDDLLGYELKSSFTATFKRAPFVTNRWRMRDKEYEQAKPPGTYRIALIGASYEMGSGVANGENYESVLEDLLNKSCSDGHYSCFEVMNFSVDGYGMVEKALVVESKLTPFDPDMVLVTVSSTEHIRVLTRITNAVSNNVPIPYPELQDIIGRAGANPWLGRPWIRERLRPYVFDIIQWSFRKLRADAEKLNLPLVVLFLPETTDNDASDSVDQLASLWKCAADAGLEPIRLNNVYGTYKLTEIQVTPWDTHPSPLGHKLIANKIYEFLVQREPQLLVKRAVGE
ncbi:MAG: hypothetical protein L0Y60_09300 [Beijerinckiaceae bacterium]|nr:hypothetical protein [Beijerinckiaceae bacterium]